jgi:hypothetical protein
MKKISTGMAVAGGLLCALALAGCQGNSGSTSGGSGSGSVTVSGTSAAATDAAPADAASQAATTDGGNPGDGVPTATPTGTAAVDSELSTVNQQLGTAGTDLAKATVSPSDGG